MPFGSSWVTAWCCSNMADCCHAKACDLGRLPKSQGRVLWIVLAINAAMFGIELTASAFKASRVALRLA